MNNIVYSNPPTPDRLYFWLHCPLCHYGPCLLTGWLVVIVRAWCHEPPSHLRPETGSCEW